MNTYKVTWFLTSGERNETYKAEGFQILPSGAAFYVSPQKQQIRLVTPNPEQGDQIEVIATVHGYSMLEKVT